MNGVLFWIYVADVLVPALKPGNMLVMDNLAAHRAASVLRLHGLQTDECRNDLAAAGHDACDPA